MPRSFSRRRRSSWRRNGPLVLVLAMLFRLIRCLGELESLPCRTSQLRKSESLHLRRLAGSLAARPLAFRRSQPSPPSPALDAPSPQSSSNGLLPVAPAPAPPLAHRTRRRRRRRVRGSLPPRSPAPWAQADPYASHAALGLVSGPSHPSARPPRAARAADRLSRPRPHTLPTAAARTRTRRRRRTRRACRCARFSTGPGQRRTRACSLSLSLFPPAHLQPLARAPS